MKSDMIKKLQETASEFRKVSDKQLSATVRRMMEENAVSMRQIAALTARAEGLKAENAQLVGREKQHQLELTAAEENGKLLTKNNRDQLEVNIKTRKEYNAIRKIHENCHDSSVFRPSFPQGIFLEINIFKSLK